MLLVYRVYRLARSVRGLAHILGELDAAGVAFRSATEPFDTATPAGRMMVQMLGVFAEFERATIIDRVIAGMERKAARGEWTSGTVTYGYAVHPETHHLVINETEAAVVRMIFDLYVNQRLGSKAISKWLNDNGHRNRNGKPWNPNYILDAVRNRTYIGELFFRGTWYIAPHEPIIALDAFERAQKLLIERGDEHRLRRSNASDYLLSRRCRPRPATSTTWAPPPTAGTLAIATTPATPGCAVAASTAPATPSPPMCSNELVVGSVIDTPNAPGVLDKALHDTWAELTAQQQRQADELAAIDTELRKITDTTERYLTAFENGTLSDASAANGYGASTIAAANSTIGAPSSPTPSTATPSPYPPKPNSTDSAASSPTP